MVPALLVAAGLGMIGYKVWADHLPLSERLRIGDIVKVPANVVAQAASAPEILPPVPAKAILEVVGLGSQTFTGRLQGFESDDGKTTANAPATPVFAALAIRRDVVVSVSRKAPDGVWRDVK